MFEPSLVSVQFFLQDDDDDPEKRRHRGFLAKEIEQRQGAGSRSPLGTCPAAAGSNAGLRLPRCDVLL